MFRSMATIVGIMLLLPLAHAGLPIKARTFEITKIYQGLHRSEISIVYPILGLPAVLEPGGELRLGVVLMEQVEGAWEAEISLYGERIQLPVRDIATWKGMYVLSTIIPENAQPGIYDVYVWKGESRDVERHALSVWEERDHLTLVHITDTHMDAGSFSDRTA